MVLGNSPSTKGKEPTRSIDHGKLSEAGQALMLNYFNEFKKNNPIYELTEKNCVDFLLGAHVLLYKNGHTTMHDVTAFQVLVDLHENGYGFTPTDLANVIEKAGIKSTAEPVKNQSDELLKLSKLFRRNS